MSQQTICEVSLAGLRFGMPSPSLLCLLGWPIQLAFIPPHGWRVVVEDRVAATPYISREAAAGALARVLGLTGQFEETAE